MAQTSTTLIASKAHMTANITGADIGFTAASGVYTIKATNTPPTALTGSGKLAVGDLITVTGASNSATCGIHRRRSCDNRDSRGVNNT